ncbi:hypothetical protein [Carboxylicivirga marina]|uniref:ATPase F0F1 n=1 Tax=Carboxylicivirga marina TaxID=2800988 RepID=A0ABS1HMV5_9BACT|nr:hypothetical protein [Carboxylicivirga marina]MBK3518608.1 hypothetical protein [Carboxylicivirga marina]
MNVFLEKKSMIRPSKEKWEKIRCKGKIRYAIVYGALGMGLFWAAITNVISHLVEPVETWHIRLILFTIGGFILGFFNGLTVWKLNERAYHNS